MCIQILALRAGFGVLATFACGHWFEVVLARKDAELGRLVRNMGHRLESILQARTEEERKGLEEYLGKRRRRQDGRRKCARRAKRREGEGIMGLEYLPWEEEGEELTRTSTRGEEEDEERMGECN